METDNNLPIINPFQRENELGNAQISDRWLTKRISGRASEDPIQPLTKATMAAAGGGGAGNSTSSQTAVGVESGDSSDRGEHTGEEK